MCVCFVTGPTPRTGNNCTSSLFIEYSILLFYFFLEHFYFILRSLKRHIESTHAGQKYEGMDYVYPHKEKGRPRTKQLKYIDSSEVVYESEEQMDSYEMEDEEDQVPSQITVNNTCCKLASMLVTMSLCSSCGTDLTNFNLILQ